MVKLNRDKKLFSYLIVSSLIIISAVLFAKASVYNPSTLQAAEPSFDQKTEEIELLPQPTMFVNTLILGIDQDGLADVIIVASYNLYTNQVIITSIPRNTYVEEQNWIEPDLGASHLCFAHYAGLGTDRNYQNGAVLTAYWVEALFGLAIHEYLTITYDAFIELVDLAGGVEVYVNPAFEGIKPNFFGRTVEPLPTGLQRLNGIQTFAFAHYRGYPDNPRIPEPGSDSEDGDRIRRNQRLIKAALSQARSMKLSEILAITRQLPAMVHTSYTIFDLTALAPDLYKVNTEELTTIVIPGEMIEVFEEGSGENTHYFIVDFEKTKELLQSHGLI